MRERNILDVHKERQPVPRYVPPLFAIDEGIDRRARRVDLFATRDVLQRRAVDHRRVQGRDDHLLVRGGKVVGGAFGERLARRVDDRTGYPRFEAIFERERVPIGGGVGVVTPLWVRVPSERQFFVRSSTSRATGRKGAHRSAGVEVGHGSKGRSDDDSSDTGVLQIWPVLVKRTCFLRHPRREERSAPWPLEGRSEFP